MRGRTIPLMNVNFAESEKPNVNVIALSVITTLVMEMRSPSSFPILSY